MNTITPTSSAQMSSAQMSSAQTSSEQLATGRHTAGERASLFILGVGAIAAGAKFIDLTINDSEGTALRSDYKHPNPLGVFASVQFVLLGSMMMCASLAPTPRNRQGDADIEMAQGDADIEMAQGDADIEMAQGDADIEIAQGDADIEIAQGDADIEIAQGAANVEMTQKDEVRLN